MTTFVHPLEEIELAAAFGAAYSRGVVNVKNGITGGAEGRALMLGREKSRSPVAVEERLAVLSRDKYDEGREVTILRSQPIREPGSHGGSPEADATGIHEHDCGVMVETVGMERTDNGDLINHFSDMRK